MSVTPSPRPVPPRRWIAAGILLAVVWSLTGERPATADGRLDEYQIKAAYLYNFAKFVTWPPDALPDPAAPFSVCVFGEDPFGSLLDDVVRGRQVGKRPLAVRRPQQVQELTSCQVLFIGGSSVPTVEDVFAKLEGRSVLTVSEREHFTHNGGVVRLFVKDGRVGFEVNLQAAQRSHLEISSQLLKIATTTRPGS